jgi:outer membrane protein OmpA-like peptidoglycan-associated protein
VLLGYWLWNSRASVQNTAFNIEEQVRLAGQKATAALRALKPGFTARDLVSALNLNVINFGTGSAQIPADQYDFLNKVAIAIKAAPANTVLEIGGYTDNTRDAASNLALSQQRAEAVRNYLIQQGVNPNVLIANGYGETGPLASNDTEEGKFRNRRIEFTVR